MAGTKKTNDPAPGQESAAVGVPTPGLPLASALTSECPRAPGARARWIILLLALAVFNVLYFYLATHLVFQTNRDRLASDQQNNIELAVKSHGHHLPHYTDGVVNPLWPWIASHIPSADHSDLFLKGKWTNVTITALFLSVLVLVCAPFFSLPALLSLLVLGGLGALLPRAVYFQPEPVYYIFFFLSWVCCLALLRKNPVWLYGVLGVVAGLAYLTKASVSLLLIAFLAVTTYRLAIGFVGRGFRRRRHESGHSGGDWSWQHHIVGLAFLATGFLVVTAPRAGYAVQKYGSPYHSYPGYWMWMDTFAPEGTQFMVKYGSREALAKLPRDERPSLTRYVRTHSNETIRNRLGDGLVSSVRRFFHPKLTVQHPDRPPRPWREVLGPRGLYIAALAAMLGFAACLYLLHPRCSGRSTECVHPETGRIVIFVLGTFLLYSLSFGWYERIGRGDRFILSLYLPILFSLIWAGESLMRAVQCRGGARWTRALYFAAHLALIAAVSHRVFELARFPFFKD